MGSGKMKGFLSLASGETFEGTIHHLKEDQTGELVVYTGMSGFQEVMTNPAYAGKLVVFSYPFIGRCGINEVSAESDHIQVDGVIMQEVSEKAYHYEATKTVRNYLEENQIPYMTNVDTRSIVKTMTKTGVQKASISERKNPPLIQKEKKHFSTPYTQIGDGSIHLAVIDFGISRSSLQLLQQENVTLTFVEANNALQTIQHLPIDGVIFTNGSRERTHPTIHKEEIKQLVQTYPTLALGVGLQLILEAFGSSFHPLPFGHYGNNYPIIDEKTKKVYITSQHHLYTLDESTLPESFTVRFRNGNDQSIEGVEHDMYAFLGLQCPIQPSILPVIQAFILSLQAKEEE